MESLGWLQDYRLPRLGTLDTEGNPLKAATIRLGEKTTGFVREGDQGLDDIFNTEEPIAKYQKGPAKPPHSIACLAAFALVRSSDELLTHSGIYAWIKSMFPYYNRMTPNTAVAWKAKVRRVLIRNRCFKECETPSSSRRSTLWTIDPKHKRELTKRLKKLGSIRKQNLKRSRRNSRLRSCSSTDSDSDDNEPTIITSDPQSYRELPSPVSDCTTDSYSSSSSSDGCYSPMSMLFNNTNTFPSPYKMLEIDTDEISKMALQLDLANDFCGPIGSPMLSSRDPAAPSYLATPKSDASRDIFSDSLFSFSPSRSLFGSSWELSSIMDIPEARLLTSM